jgi:hypothetical protein
MAIIEVGRSAADHFGLNGFLEYIANVFAHSGKTHRRTTGMAFLPCKPSSKYGRSGLD